MELEGSADVRYRLWWVLPSKPKLKVMAVLDLLLLDIATHPWHRNGGR